MTEANISPDQASGIPPRKVEPVSFITGATDTPIVSAVVHPKTNFWRGIWANKSNENEIESVRLGVQGEVLTFQRGVECIVPEPYLDVAKNARYPKFKQEPGKGRKTVAYIDRFPFQKLRPATYEEFRKMFLEGNKKTRQAVEQHGLNVPIEQAVPQLE